jgi:uncharacterized protein (DUF1697 family)
MIPNTFIALLRGINVGGRNLIPMRDLCPLCASLGWQDVQSYIQSGNLVFQASAAPKELEIELERAVARRFDLSIPVIIRKGTAWPGYVRDNPYPDASESEPNHVMLVLSKAPPKAGAAKELQERAMNGERIVQVGDALWVHYAAGVATSKLTPALLDRLVGSPVTARNWRTVLKLQAMAAVAAGL